MIKQRRTDDGTMAMDRGVCVIAMLTDLPYEKVLADNPNYRALTNLDWMRYLNILGFQKMLRHPVIAFIAGLLATAMEKKSATQSLWTRKGESLTRRTARLTPVLSRSSIALRTARLQSTVASRFAIAA